jgi:hypothetical protein
MVAAPDWIVITAPDSNGNLDLWWQWYGAVPWNGQQVAAG